MIALRGQACSLSHFVMKLLFAAPFSGLPSDPTALGVQASRLHFAIKLVLAAPARGFPFLPTALLSQVSWAAAEPSANASARSTYINDFILSSFLAVCDHFKGRWHTTDQNAPTRKPGLQAIIG